MTCIVFDPDTVTKMKAILLYTLAQLTILYMLSRTSTKPRMARCKTGTSPSNN